MTDETKDIDKDDILEDGELDEDYEDYDEEDNEDIDDDLEYDDDGNIILDVDDDEEDDTPSDKDDTENKDTGKTVSKSVDITDDSVDTPGAPDQKDTRIAQLEKELKELKELAGATLKTLGHETNDINKGLMKVAAEQQDMSYEEYAQKQAREKDIQDAINFRNQAQFNAIYAKDLQDLQRLYPELRNCNKINDIPNFNKFAYFRAKSLSLTEAYAAANPEGIRQAAAQASQQRSINNTKSHLKSNVPKSARDASIKMSKEDYQYWKELFPDKSSKEIFALYKETL